MGKFLSIALAGLLTTAPVVAIQQAGNVVTLTDDEIAHCREGGGCVVMTRSALLDALRQVQAKCGTGA
jgi:hypothetical protein